MSPETDSYELLEVTDDPGRRGAVAVCMRDAKMLVIRRSRSVVAPLAYWFLSERLNRTQLIGIVSAVVGVLGPLIKRFGKHRSWAVSRFLEALTVLLIPLNFAALEYISSAGLRVLLATAKKLKASGGDLKICSLNDTVQEVFDISGFSSILTVSKDQEEALASF